MKTNKDTLNKLFQQKEQIEIIIQRFLSDDMTEKQSVELYHVGKFLSLIGGSSIVNRTESPDFIISHKNEIIGLEHERLFISDKVRMIKSIQKLFDDSAELFEKNYPEYKIIANCWLTTNNFKFQKRDIDRLKTEISKYIYALASRKNNVEKPPYIKEVRFTKHCSVNFIYNPGAYFVQYLSSDILIRAIQKKEKLVSDYIENSKKSKQWLLIVIGSISPDSYQFGDFPFSIDIASPFEKIFLMEDFKCKVWQLK